MGYMTGQFMCCLQFYSEGLTRGGGGNIHSILNTSRGKALDRHGRVRICLLNSENTRVARSSANFFDVGNEIMKNFLLFSLDHSQATPAGGEARVGRVRFPWPET